MKRSKFNAFTDFGGGVLRLYRKEARHRDKCFVSETSERGSEA